MTKLRWIISLAFAVLGSSAAWGQPVGPVKGIVWSPPTTFAEIRTDLENMASDGAHAIRGPLIFDPKVQVAAEFFGLSFFQEIDARFLPAPRYAKRRAAFVAALDSAVAVASQVDGPHRFGLGYWIDTSVPGTCKTIRELRDRVRSRLPDAQVYYVSAFIESDLCSDDVDFVLLDAKGLSSAADLLRRWRHHSKTPVGISGIGFPVRAGAGHGYLAGYSPQQQARGLEKELSGLLADRNLTAVFVNRWKARAGWSEETADEVGDYGIIAPDGSPRPAVGVVKGLYTGQQRVFAFDAGEPSGNDYSWINLIGFLCVALFGLTYYGSMGLRSILRRYFLSHSIYLEKLSDGREATVGTSLFLLLCLSLSAGLVGMTVVTDSSGTRLWYPLLHWLPEWLAEPLQIGVARSGLLVVVFAALFALVTLLWAATLSLSTRGSKHLRFRQTLLTAVMPRWPVALIGLLALVLLNWRIDAPGFALVVVTGVWSAVVLSYTGRMLSDFLRLLGIRALWTIPVLFLGLCLLAGTVWLVVVTKNFQAELVYLWNIVNGT